MTKTFHTKRKIIELLSSGKYNITEIAENLGISVSTASQHVKELSGIGAIYEVHNPYIKKWKYYRANEKFDVNKIENGVFMNNIKYIIGAIVVIAALGILFFALHNRGAQVMPNNVTPYLNNGNSTVTFSLTDPPHVPIGTNALIITYSSIEAHISGSNTSSGWIHAGGNGTLDLMSLINASSIIANAQLPSNSLINQVRFNISSAHITINGTIYNVTVPNNQVTAKITEGGRINSSENNVLIDLTPTIAAIYTQNSTVFVMVPSVRAIVVSGGGNNAEGKIGTKFALQPNEREMLNETSSLINITSANVSLSGANTTVYVTVKNTGNTTDLLQGIMLIGSSNVVVSPMDIGRIDTGNNGSLNINTSGQNNAGVREEIRIDGQDNSNQTRAVIKTNSDPVPIEINAATRDWSNISIQYNSSMSGNIVSSNTFKGNYMIFHIRNDDGIYVVSNGTFNSPSYVSQGIGSKIQNSNDKMFGFNTTFSTGIMAAHLNRMYFIVMQNGTLSLPMDQQGFEGENGYALAPGASITLKYNGKILLGNNHISINIVPNTSYRIVVHGNNGAYASANVVAVQT